ncbi:MAG: hypothetical protein Q9M14_02465 [Mariprofundaceae bacterium]|nr:hypothetical protein [Mariprofundaceae bacterium]
MDLNDQQVIYIGDLARILGCTERAIRIRQSRGQEGSTLPRSLKIGGRRVWMRATTIEWIKSLEYKVK